jgi:hypothetical protein
MSQSLITVPKLRFSEPRHNLPGRKGIATAEDRFTIAFTRAYFQQAEEIHRRCRKTSLAFAREIPVNGYGIADLHVVAWEALSAESFPDVESFARVVRPSTRAFECKLADWRKALAQAGRYRFFSHQAFVVLPQQLCLRVLPYVVTFKAVRVGLWGFTPETGAITVYHTPRPTKPKSERYYFHAIESVARASRQSLPIP